VVVSSRILVVEGCLRARIRGMPSAPPLIARLNASSSVADVVKSSVVAQGHDAGLVDLVGADPVVGLWLWSKAGGRTHRQAARRSKYPGAVWSAEVRSSFLESVQQGLSSARVVGCGVWQPLLHGLLEASSTLLPVGIVACFSGARHSWSCCSNCCVRLGGRVRQAGRCKPCRCFSPC